MLRHRSTAPLGVLLAVPMTATIKIILQNIPTTERYAKFLEKARGERSIFGRRGKGGPDDEDRRDHRKCEKHREAEQDDMSLDDIALSGVARRSMGVAQ